MYSTRYGVAKDRRTAVLCAVLLALGTAPALALGEEIQGQMPMNQNQEMMMAADTDEAAHKPINLRLLFPVMNSNRGKTLFLEKGCFACHTVNGVGGHEATPLDAHTMDAVMSPFDLAAKMWANAPIMIAAQIEAFGEQILFTGDELADIIAFLHDDDAQHGLDEGYLTVEMLVMMDHQHGIATALVAHAEEIGHVQGPDGPAEEGQFDD